MPASRAPAALTATIVLLATLVLLSILTAFVLADFRAGIAICAGLLAICVLLLWGVRGA